MSLKTDLRQQLSCASKECANPTTLAIYGQDSQGKVHCQNLSSICCKETVVLPKDVALICVGKNKLGRALVTAAHVSIPLEEAIKIPGCLRTPDRSLGVRVVDSEGRRVLR